MRALQKICRQGNSAHITIPRPLLFKLNLMFGDFIELSEQNDGILRIRKYQLDEEVTTQSPGILPDKPVMVKP